MEELNNHTIVFSTLHIILPFTLFQGILYQSNFDNSIICFHPFQSLMKINMNIMSVLYLSIHVYFMSN